MELAVCSGARAGSHLEFCRGTGGIVVSDSVHHTVSQFASDVAGRGCKFRFSELIPAGRITDGRMSSTVLRQLRSAARSAVYEQARQRHPARWSRSTRDWSPIAMVTLNPERDVVVAAERRNQDIQPRVA